MRETLDDVLTPIIYAEALELIEEHKRAGRKTVIISSSPIETVEPIGEYLGVDDVIATRARLDADGRYTGELEFYAYGPHKADAIREMAVREGIDLARSYAYSDSITDLPMLELVGNPVAVNPDRELARVAREREWEMRYVPAAGAPARPRAGAAEGTDDRRRQRGRRGRHGRRAVRVAAPAQRGRARLTPNPERASGGADLVDDDGTQGDEHEQQQQLLHEFSFGGDRSEASQRRCRRASAS